VGLPPLGGRVALLELDGGADGGDGAALPAPSLMLALAAGGFHTLLLRRDGGAWGAPPYNSSSLLLLPAGCAAAHGGAAHLALLLASSAGAETVLWLPHWRSGGEAGAGLSAPPRYYAPAAALPALADAAADGARLVASHFYSPPPAGAPDVLLCMPGGGRGGAGARGVGLPLLQLGLCPAGAPGSTALSEAVGVLLAEPTAAALSAAATRHNALAYRPAFPLLAALMVSAAAGEPPPLVEALRGAAAGAYDLALLAPGALCGDAHALYGARHEPPRVLSELPPPPVPAGCLVSGGGCGVAAAAGGVVPPPSAATLLQPWRASAGAGAALRQATAAAWASAALAGAAAPGAGARGPRLPPLLIPPEAVSPADAWALRAAPGGACFPARPWRRDLALLIVFNTGSYATAATLATLRGLYQRAYPLLLALASLEDDPSLGRLSCDTGPGGNDAHLCLARGLPLAFGRVGAFFLMDDALLAPWATARFDARRFWFTQLQWGSNGNLGPSGMADHAVSGHLGTLFINLFIAWYARGLMSAEQRAMQVANSGALGRGVEVVKGATDVVYMPRAAFAAMARLCLPESAKGLYQEVFLAVAVLANSAAQHVEPLRRPPRAVPQEGQPPKNPDWHDWRPLDHTVHPWKLATNPAAAQRAQERFDGWYAMPPSCPGSAVLVEGDMGPWSFSPTWAAAACTPTAHWEPGEGLTLGTSDN